MKVNLQAIFPILVVALMVAVAILSVLAQRSTRLPDNSSSAEFRRAEELQQLLSQTSVPVLVEFYADW